MNNQWKPSEVLIDGDDSHLDQPIFIEYSKAIVKELHPIFPPSHYLKIAGDLIESGWIIRAEAVNAEGRNVEPEAEDAVKWCTIGAMKAGIKYAPSDFRQYMLRYLQSVFNAANAGLMLKHEWVWVNNDNLNPHSEQDHALIVRMFRRAEEFALTKIGVDKWPDAPFEVTKIQGSEVIHG